MGVNEERPRSKAELSVHSIVWGKRELCIEAVRSSQRCRERREGNGRETDDSGEHNGNHAFWRQGAYTVKGFQKASCRKPANSDHWCSHMVGVGGGASGTFVRLSLIAETLAGGFSERQ